MKKLTKSNTDIVLAGVLGGIAEYFQLDPTLVRVGYVILSFVAIGAPVLLYILLAIIIPRDYKLNEKGRGGKRLMRRLTRSRNDKIFTGLIGGIGEYLGFDPTIIRIIFAVLVLSSLPLPIIPLYIVASIIIPKAPKGENRRKEREARKERVDRAFSKSKPVNETSSRQTQPIEDDDWSDF